MLLRFHSLSHSLKVIKRHLVILYSLLGISRSKNILKRVLFSLQVVLSGKVLILKYIIPLLRIKYVKSLSIVCLFDLKITEIHEFVIHSCCIQIRAVCLFLFIALRTASYNNLLFLLIYNRIS